MNRQAFIDRLRAWAARADNEVVYARTDDDRLSWQGHAAVLHAIANAVASGASGQGDPRALRLQIIADRQKALANWNAQRAEIAAAQFTGETQAYDLVLELLQDADASWAA